MEIRVAVASSNGATVNEHFGRAKNFTIYRLVEEIWQHVEERPNLPPCNGHCHSDTLLEQTATLLRDCQGVIINQIGPGAMDTLLYRNILPFALSGSIEDALATVRDSKLFRVRNKIG
ncbi:NifB/NifX family molybdenum-iron cluster-binding protein [Geotalea toluenoxydans]